MSARTYRVGAPDEAMTGRVEPPQRACATLQRAETPADASCMRVLSQSLGV
ncbi:MAG TPA: hypothetical protein VHW67_08115 [Solirubrobacteraceae bacterium]|nr:hypothetical protein [Solirubrobacteraceae bacterium]